MRRTIIASALALGLVAAGNANAASFITSNGAVSLDRTDDFSWVANLAGSTNNGAATLTGKIVYTFQSANAAGTEWRFSYSVLNTSTATNARSELASFGFNSSSGTSSASASADLYQAAVNTGNFNGLGNRDVCLFAGSNCNGGGSNGVSVAHGAETGTFLVRLGSGTQRLVLEDFVARWQSTGSNGQGSASAVGVVANVENGVPEPATWGMMLLGFGVAGASMRRRRSTSVTYA